MSSIILSFVGTQDPYADRTKEEGSIVTSVKHLSAIESEIGCLYLLFTDDRGFRASRLFRRIVFAESLRLFFPSMQKTQARAGFKSPS